MQWSGSFVESIKSLFRSFDATKQREMVRESLIEKFAKILAENLDFPMIRRRDFLQKLVTSLTETEVELLSRIWNIDMKNPELWWHIDDELDFIDLGAKYEEELSCRKAKKEKQHAEPASADNDFDERDELDDDIQDYFDQDGRFKGRDYSDDYDD